jgi:hypothetical protein
MEKRKRQLTAPEMAYQNIVATRDIMQIPFEENILALMLSSKEVADQVASKGVIETDGGEVEIHDGLFQIPRCLTTFQALKQLIQGGDPMAPTMIVARSMRICIAHGFDHTGMADLGWVEKLRRMVPEYSPSTAGQFLVDQALARKFIRVGCELIHLAVDTPREEYMRIHERLMGILGSTDHSLTGSRLMVGEDAAKSYNAVLAERRRLHEAGYVNPLHWPWPSWRYKMRLNPPLSGKFTTIIGLHGQGKTIVNGCLSDHYAKMGLGVAVLLTEDSKDDYMDRQMARYSGVPLEVIQACSYDAEQQALLSAAADEIQGRNGQPGFIDRFAIYECGGLSIRETLAGIEPLIAKKRVDVIVVDYLNSFARRARDESARYAEIGNDGDYLKGLSQAWKTPAIVFNQVTKEGEHRAHEKGYVAANDEYGGAMIMHSSRTRITFYRAKVGEAGFHHPETGKLVAEHNEPSPIAKFVVEKQNGGVSGRRADMWFDGPRFTLEEIPGQGG